MNLIVQGRRIHQQHLDRLVMLSGASVIEAITPHAFRLRRGFRFDGIAEYCAQAELDHAFVPEDRKLTDFGLVVMDMDSTVITIECIDELADIHGIKPQIAAITAATMRGEIYFAESLRRRVALLTGLEATALSHVYDERLTLTPGVEIMLQTMKAAQLKTLLVTGGFSFFAERLKIRLGIDYIASNEVEIVAGRLTGKIRGIMFSPDAKADIMDSVRQDLGLEKRQVIAIGDGANDIKMMVQASVSIAYKAKPIVQRQATHTLNHVNLSGVLHLFG